MPITNFRTMHTFFNLFGFFGRYTTMLNIFIKFTLTKVSWARTAAFKGPKRRTWPERHTHVFLGRSVHPSNQTSDLVVKNHFYLSTSECLPERLTCRGFSLASFPATFATFCFSSTAAAVSLSTTSSGFSNSSDSLSVGRAAVFAATALLAAAVLTASPSPALLLADFCAAALICGGFFDGDGEK